ncbi:hypothetical protein GOP47_0001386, partial [Adiantum capillus-veneris]
SHHWRNIATPQPRVTPFPVAHHRSEGPHWAPPSIQPVHTPGDDKEDLEDKDGEQMASMAQPLVQKKKKEIDISKWKAEKGSMRVSNVVRDSQSGAGTSFAQMDTFASKLDKLEDQAIILEGLGNNLAEHRATFATIESLPADSHDYAPSSAQLASTTLASIESVITSPSATSEDKRPTNEILLETMTIEQIAEAQQELAERFRPDILDMLRRRGKEKADKQSRDHRNLDAQMAEASESNSKVGNEISQQFEQDGTACVAGLSEDQASVLNTSSIRHENLRSQFHWEGRCWTERVEAVRTFRFGLDGNFVSADSATVLPTTGDKESEWKIPNVTERDFLRMEGDPSLHGYTIKEGVALARSMVPAQRSAALRLISNILNKATMSLQQSGASGESFGMTSSSYAIVDWQAVWAYALGPEPDLVLTLRIALDDSHATAVVACARALEFLLSSSANEQHFNLCECLLPSEFCAFTAPVFKKPFFKESGLIGDCFWKYNANPVDMFPYSKNSQSQEEDTDATVKDDAFVANQDVAAGLIRMGILPRIRYLLEVERLTSAEDSLFAILIALSRHSPGAADAVMKCPRLINTIHELFVCDETRTWSARHKAINLLKVLSIAKKSNCIKFLNMGTFDRSQLGLLNQALAIGTPKGFQEKGSWAELVESLQFWRVCVKYGLCISCFSDYYPALIFWTATPSTRQSLQANYNAKDVALAEASFHVLEALAKTLPVLHGAKDLDQSTSEFSPDFWSWRFSIPIIEDSLGWLSLDFVQGCTEKLMQLPDGHESAQADTQNFLRVVSSVLHFLSTVCDRIVEEGNSGSKWLPTFVPKVGLQLINSGMVCFSASGGLEPSIFSFANCVAKIKQKVSEEYLLDVMNCLFGLVRLLKILDRLLVSVKDKQASKACDLNDCWGVNKILQRGLAVSAKKELLQLLKDTGDNLIQKSSSVPNRVGDYRRGGPAPGVGIGWGCKGGGYWSHQMLTTQVELVLVQELIDLLSLEGILSEDLLYNDETWPSSYGELEPWRLKVSLSILSLAGPCHRDLVEHVCCDSIFREISIGFYIKRTDFLVKKWLLKLGKSKNSQEIEFFFSNVFQNVPNIKHILLQHVSSMWLSPKVKQISGEIEGLDKKLARKDRSSKRSSILSTVLEEEAVIPSTSYKESLAVQWAGQKLPLPCFWFLSPLLSNIGLHILGGSLDAGEVVRDGLILLFGLEALMESFPLHIPFVRKIHSLSNIFVISDDVFLDSGVNIMIGALQEKFTYDLDCAPKCNEAMDDIDMNDQNVPEDTAKKDMEHKLDFEGLVDERYPSFLDKLTSQFASVSYGDLVFSRQVAIYLRRDVSESLRLRVWKSLESDHMLEFLPPLAQCCGPFTSYLYPVEESQDMLKAYATSLASGALDRGRFRQSVSFFLAAFHIAAFIFTKGSDDEAKLLRKTFAKNFLLQLAQRSQFQEILLELLNCKVPEDPEPIPYGVDWSFVPSSDSEVKLRCAFLEEACAQYSHLKSKIRQLKNL